MQKIGKGGNGEWSKYWFPDITIIIYLGRGPPLIIFIFRNMEKLAKLYGISKFVVKHITVEHSQSFFSSI